MMNNPDQPASETREEILPCPFCGQLPRAKRQGDRWGVECLFEGCSIQPYSLSTEETRERAIEIWNNRFSEPVAAQTESVSAPTPRTDAAFLVGHGIDPKARYVTLDFARQLERELSAKTVEVERLKKKISELEIIARAGAGAVKDWSAADEENRQLREELQNIANARPSTWDDPDQFLPWAQNRARHALEKSLSDPATVKDSLQVRDGEWVEKAAVSPDELGALYDAVLNIGMGDPWDGEELETGFVRPIPEGFEKEVEKFDVAREAQTERLNACLDTIRDFIVRQRRHLSESPSDQGWRPIESAPRDGKVIIGYMPEFARIRTINWNENHWAQLPGAWTANPSHWQPLPNPPTGEREGQG